MCVAIFSKRLSETFIFLSGPGSPVGMATDYEMDGLGIEKKSQWGRNFSCPDQPWGPPSLLYNGYHVFPGSKVAGAWC
jgi:hypothetical protein